MFRELVKKYGPGKVFTSYGKICVNLSGTIKKIKSLNDYSKFNTS